MLATVPGIGRKLAAYIHEHLGIETLADLETAAYDGRLEALTAFGPKRLRGVRETLAGRFHHPPHVPQPHWSVSEDQPPVAELLELDRTYRLKAKQGRLPQIAPRRFNPTGAAWLPVLHTHRGKRHYTVLFSNTARAHELGMTHDWVVIYRDDHNGGGQWTVVTAQFGVLRTRRIVRGREAECEAYYAES